MPSQLIELEHELAAALRKVDEQMELLRLCKEEDNEKHKDIIWGMGERAKLMERIERLEDILKRASYEFFRDGSDGQVASRMLTILEEVRKL
jgi:predicted ArsR family transcriptional regulator